MQPLSLLPSVTLGPSHEAAIWPPGSGLFPGRRRQGVPNRDELDLWIQYRPTEGPFKGLRVKTQYSNLWQQGNVRESQSEFRFIVDYTVLFRPPMS